MLNTEEKEKGTSRRARTRLHKTGNVRLGSLFSSSALNSRMTIIKIPP